MTAAWSATDSAISAFCSTTSEATPSSRSLRMVASTSPTIFGASPWLGSSNRISPGAPTRARAIATICISPPDRFSHSRSIRYSSGEKISQVSLTVQLRNRVRFCAMPRLRATESVGHSRRSSGTQPMPPRAISCVGLCVTSRPSNRIAPRRGRVRPRIERSIVVLPAPLGPSSANTFPRSTASDAPNSAWVSP